MRDLNQLLAKASSVKASLRDISTDRVKTTPDERIRRAGELISLAEAISKKLLYCEMRDQAISLMERAEKTQEWLDYFKRKNLPHTSEVA